MQIRMPFQFARFGCHDSTLRLPVVMRLPLSRRFPVVSWQQDVTLMKCVLSKLYQSKEAVMFDLLEKAFFAGMGAVALSKKKTDEFLAELKESCRVSEEEGKAFLERTQELAQEGRQRLFEMAETEVKRVVDKVGLVPREEFNLLLKRVEELEETLRKG
ncbi:MAG: hypothetical protein PHO83_12475 [Geobacteraceae bacterium]|nr:hypothetical protein [Geobacteraceae bacterium]